MLSAFAAAHTGRLRHAHVCLQRLNSKQAIRRDTQVSVRQSAATINGGHVHTRSPSILITNDDGVDPDEALAIDLGRTLAEAGHDVTVVAPGRDNSACGQSVSLHGPLTLRRHGSLETTRLRVFSVLEGTPADCAAAAIEPSVGILARLGLYPRLVVSGVNVGPNLGTDVLYSGTVAGARQAALYGIPAIATSLAVHNAKNALPGAPARAIGLRATTSVVNAVLAALPPPAPPRERVAKPSSLPDAPRDAFARGDIMLNINVPGDWAGGFASTTLDTVLYHNAVRLEELPKGDATVKFALKAASKDFGAGTSSDSAAIDRGLASISLIQTWPWSSPYFVAEDVMRAASVPGEGGLPAWLSCATVVPER